MRLAHLGENIMTNDNLNSAFRYHRQHGCRAVIALRNTRQDISEGKPRYPEPGAPGTRGYGNYWTQNDDEGTPCPSKRYVRNVARVLRFVGTSYDICRSEGSRQVDAQGYYSDAFQEETMEGVVLQLPGRKGKPLYVAGYRSSMDGSNDKGAIVLFDCITEEKLDAAQWGDSAAEHAAELEREYQAASQAGLRFYDLGEEIKEHRSSVLALCAELKKARKLAGTLDPLPTICATIRSAIKSNLRDIRKAREKRAQLASGYGASDSDFESCFNSSESRLVDAFNESACL